jgi:type III pantothenate kinase
MKPDVVVDVGNTRIKWGLRDPAAPRIGRTASLPDDPAAWAAQRDEWHRAALLPSPAAWVVASVQPQRSECFRRWIEEYGDRVTQLQFASQLPLAVGLEKPDHVGIDRLLNAVAAHSILPPGRPAILVDAGSAVTVDWLDETHTFRGGAIFPGLRLMAEALHQYTALLPRVAVTVPVPQLPGPATIPAMQAGIYWAVIGGIICATQQLTRFAPEVPEMFLTGGDGALLLDGLRGHGEPVYCLDPTLWPEQTLEGIRHSAEALP